MYNSMVATFPRVIGDASWLYSEFQSKAGKSWQLGLYVVE